MKYILYLDPNDNLTGGVYWNLQLGLLGPAAAHIHSIWTTPPRDRLTERRFVHVNFRLDRIERELDIR